MGATCPSANTENVEQESFWVGGEWDGHKVGWAIAGGCALLVRILFLLVRSTIVSTWADCQWC